MLGILTLLSHNNKTYAKNINIPPTIQETILSLEKDCGFYAKLNDNWKQSFNKIQNSSIFDRFKNFNETDINKDGKYDYVVNDTNKNISCGSTHGASGEGIIIFMNIDGKMKKVYSQEVISFTVQGNNVYIIVGGKFCNQPNFSNKDTATICRRKILWNDVKKIVTLGKINEI